MPGNENDDGMPPLMENAIMAHELYTAYVKAGFTPDQAIQLLIGLMMVSGNNPVPPQSLGSQ